VFDSCSDLYVISDSVQRPIRENPRLIGIKHDEGTSHCRRGNAHPLGAADGDGAEYGWVSSEQVQVCRGQEDRDIRVLGARIAGGIFILGHLLLSKEPSPRTLFKEQLHGHERSPGCHHLRFNPRSGPQRFRGLQDSNAMHLNEGTVSRKSRDNGPQARGSDSKALEQTERG
jgi:hypothetical protein